MEEDKLLIITKFKKTYEYILKSLDNFPHKNIELKQHINNTVLDIIELCYYANNGYDVERNKIMALSKLSMADYYLKLSFKYDIISKKKYESIAKHLLEIKLMLKSWINTENEEEK